MDYFLRRERRRLVKDIIELQREDDLRKQIQSVMYNLKELDRHRIYSSGDEEYEEHYHHRRHHQRKESKSCLMTLRYRGANVRRHVDEIMIMQYNQTVFKGCLQQEDQFTFKLTRYRDKSRFILEFYINDLLEDEMKSCCEHGLIDNDQEHLFEIEQITGSKPCYECELENNTSIRSGTNSTPSVKARSFQKVKATSPVVSLSQSSSVSSEEQSYQQQSYKKKPTLSVPETPVKKSTSEGFSPDITEFPEVPKPKPNRLEVKKEAVDDTAEFSALDHVPPPKPTYGPPQLSTMLSTTESFDTSSLPPFNVREQSTGNSTSNSLNNQPRRLINSDSNHDENQNETNTPSATTQFLRSMSSNIEDNQSSSMSISNPNDIAAANDATNLLLTRLGFMRQQQIERPEPSTDDAPRSKGNVEYFTLIYLYSSNPDDSVIKNLHSLVNYVKIFNDIDDCVAFMNSIINEKILLILPNSFRNLILPRIEDLQQIFTIYILCENDDEITSSINRLKIQGSYTNLNDIYKQILNDINQVTRDLNIYIILSTNSDTIDPVFVYYQLLNEIILDESETENGLQELINFSRQEYSENEEELKLINEFENTYQQNQAIQWFLRQCFLFKMLNKALRVPEADILFKLRLFIQHLYKQIRNESTSESITVYLGQTMQRKDLDDLQEKMSNNYRLLFPQFTLGSTDQTRANRIAKELPSLGDDFLPAVIHINIPSDMKCACIIPRRYAIDDDNDVLLNMDMMTQITKIDKDNINEDGIARIYLTIVKCQDERNIQEILETKRSDINKFVQLSCHLI